MQKLSTSRRRDRMEGVLKKKIIKGLKKQKDLLMAIKFKLK